MVVPEHFVASLGHISPWRGHAVTGEGTLGCPPRLPGRRSLAGRSGCRVVVLVDCSVGVCLQFPQLNHGCAIGQVTAWRDVVTPMR